MRNFFSRTGLPILAAFMLALIAPALAPTLAPTLALADGLIVIENSPIIIPGHFRFAPLEVTYHKVDCTIDDQAAVTSVDQEFYNPNNARLEGEYIFPVPKDANIDKFTMDIDGKPVQAELLPADKARAIYENIVRASRDPALLEYAGRAMFKVHIFPIEPNSKKRIQIKYTELLKQDNGLLDYHYTLNTEKYSSKPLQNLSLKITIASTQPITTLYSPTHNVEIKRHDDNHAVVGFEAQNARPDTDFHLFIGRKATPVGINLLTYRPDPTKDGYFVLLAAPTVAKAAKPMPKDVVFVMDTSGSMSGTKIEQARKALKYCIDTLNPQDRFDIVRFSTESEPFFSKLVEATDDNRKKATDFVAKLNAAGGTAIDEALSKALDEVPAIAANKPTGKVQTSADRDRLAMIVFMTDGQPTVGEQNPDAILAHLKKQAAGVSVRCFTFGVGNDVNTKLLDLLADQTKGYTQYVLPNENLEISMSNFWGKVQDPILANLKLDLGDSHATKLYPKDLPDIFKGDQLVVFGTYTKSGSGAITITGTADGKEQQFAQDVTFEDKTDSSQEWIAKLWATRRIGYLLDEIRLHGESKELKDEVVELARHWGVVTPYTAMLIMEDEKNRGVPMARQSLREMEQDKAAMPTLAADYDSLRRKEESGAQAVSNSVNTFAYKSAGNLQQSTAAAGQTLAHAQVNDASAMARGGATSGPGAIAAAPFDITKVPNAGPQTISGWQMASGKAARDTGYRIITNYAQQSRVINNRAFYLNCNQWTDSTIQKTLNAKPITITSNSEAYFDLLKTHPEAAQYLALGNNITLDLAGQIYDISEETPPPPVKQNP